MINSFDEYEKAKSKLRDNGSLHAERLKKALLEYRRQHNIFEAEDWVIPKQQTCDEFFEPIQIERVGRNGEYYDTKWRMLNIDLFRHATPEEIKAGRRL